VPPSAEPQPRRAASQGASASAAAAASVAAGHAAVVQQCSASQPSHDRGPVCCANTRRRLGACGERLQASPALPDSAAADRPAACCSVSDSASSRLVQEHDRISTGAVAHSSHTSRFVSPARPGRARDSSSTAAANGRRRQQQRRRPAALHALHFAVLAVLAACAAGTEINTAVSIFGPWDYELRQDGTSRYVSYHLYAPCRDRLLLVLPAWAADRAPLALSWPVFIYAAAASLCCGP